MTATFRCKFSGSLSVLKSSSPLDNVPLPNPVMHGGSHECEKHIRTAEPERVALRHGPTSLWPLPVPRWDSGRSTHTQTCNSKTSYQALSSVKNCISFVLINSFVFCCNPVSKSTLFKSC